MNPLFIQQEAVLSRILLFYSRAKGQELLLCLGLLGEAAEGEAVALDFAVRRVDCTIGTVEEQVVRAGSTGKGGTRPVPAVPTLIDGTGAGAAATEDKLWPSSVSHSSIAIIVIVESLVFSRRVTGWEAEGFQAFLFLYFILKATFSLVWLLGEAAEGEAVPLVVSAVVRRVDCAVSAE